MEAGREILPKDDDEAVSGHMEIAGLFEKTILFIGQTYHDQINGVPIGKESRVAALLVGVYNIRPPQSRYTFIWDFKKVIDFLVNLNSPNEICLKDLNLKLTMLLAMTSAARA